MRENRIDEAWLALHDEPVLEPERPIIDAHHHVRIAPKHHYLYDELRADLTSGHNIRATVWVEGDYRYRDSGPEAMRPVGEIEFISGVAERFAAEAEKTAGPRACAALVGYADLRLGAAIRDVLLAEIDAGKGRLRGIRGIANWDARIGGTRGAPPQLLADAKFREGFAQLGALGLTYDAIQFGSQTADVTGLARRFPDTTIILNHCGMPLLNGPYRGAEAEVMAQLWRDARELAACPNVCVKLGGMGIQFFGLDLWARERPAPSEEVARIWRPYIEPWIEMFGPERCMFESDFPVDKPSVSYRVLWNAFKRLAAPYSETQKQAMFEGAARRVYRIPE